jgi:uncharacterized Tic20 family protein
MQNPSQTLPTSEERVLAGLAHWLGLLVAVIIWATQKDRSRYVRFQAAQAMAFDVVIMIGASVVGMCMALVVIVGTLLMSMGGLVAAAGSAGDENSAFPILFLILFQTFPLLFVCLSCPLVVLVTVVLVFRFIAIINAFIGNDYRYPILGNWVLKLLGEPVV